MAEHTIHPGGPKGIGLVLPLAGNPFSVQIIETRKPGILTRTDINLVTKQAQNLTEEREVQCIIVLPLLSRGEVIGTVGVETSRPGRVFTPAEMSLAETIAGQIAGAIENARLFEAEHKARIQAETLYAVSLALSSTMNLQEVFELVLKELRKVVPYDSASVQRLTKDYLEIIGGIGFSNLPAIIGLKLNIDQGAVNRQLLAKRAPLIIEDVQIYPEFHTEPHASLGSHSWLGVPLFFGDRLLGVITLDKKEPGFYTEDHARLAVAFATQAAIAIENAQLYTEAQQARAVAEAASQAKSKFLATMSHEFRTPLNGILGYAQILKDDKNLTPQQLEEVNIIQQSGEHLLTLINDILDLSKIEAGRVELSLTEIHLPTFLKRISDIIRVRAEQNGIIFVYHPYNFTSNQPTTHLPTDIRADEKRLRQVLINLLGNAIKFTPRGQVSFKVGYAPGPSVSEGGNLRQIRFQIEDTGVGVAPEQLEAIFQPFQQGEISSLQIEGTGLGLAISRNLVRLMGGELRVRSKLNEGSTFWFDLALLVLSNGLEPLSTSRREIIGYKGPKRKVLIVDEESTNRLLLVKLLSPLGFEVREATDSEEGLRQALAFQPDLSIIDLMLPLKRGLELIRNLRRFPSLSNQAIIMASASVFEENQRESLAAGSNAFIPKPIQKEGLLAEIRRCLQLEWLYEVVKPERWPGDALEITPPPLDQIKRLFNLARLGDVAAIQDLAQELKTLDPQFEPFAETLLHLAGRFEINKLSQFLEPYLD
jgi:signal transduction histidine kinase/CheY-like chemotaxis protein